MLNRNRPANAGHARCRRERHAITLVELLVTIAIIAVLAGLLLPALGAAREAARRSSCMHNISQVAKSIIAWDSDKSRLPGWRDTVDEYTKVQAGVAARRPEACVSWTVVILPFLDQREIYDWYETYDGAGGVDDVAKKKLPIYLCTSAAGDAQNRSPLSYVVNGGTGGEVLQDDGRQYGGDGAFVDVAGNSAEAAWHLAGGGYQTYRGDRTSLAQIGSADGAGSTLLIAERSGLAVPSDISWAAHPRPAVAHANAVAAAHIILHAPQLAPGAEPPSSGVRVVNPTAETRPVSGSDWALRYPSSRHAGGANAAFCDGHTRFIRDTIAPWVYCQILTSNKRVRSPRATQWERYIGPDGGWVHYLFDDGDLDK